MMSLNIYALEEQETHVLTSFWVSPGDKEASTYMLDNLEKIYNEVPEKERDSFLNRIRKANIVRVGSINLLSHELNSDFCCLVNLQDFRKEVNKENGAS